VKPTAEQIESAKKIWEIVMEEPFNPKTDYGLPEIKIVAAFLASRDAPRAYSANLTYALAKPSRRSWRGKRK
jgi:hypothetical protein